MGYIPICSCLSNNAKQYSDIPVYGNSTTITLNKKKQSLLSSKTDLSVKSGKYKIRSLSFNQQNIEKTVEYLLNILCVRGKPTTFTNMKTKPKGSDESLDVNDSLNNSTFPKSPVQSHIISTEEEAEIQKGIREHFVHQDLSQDILSLVMNELIYCSVSKDKVIYQEGEEGNFFFIIGEGEVQSTKKGKVEKTYKTWDCFGAVSLLSQAKREETMISSAKVSLFCIDGESFRDIINRINEKILKERFLFLNQIAIFKSLDNISKYNVAQKIILKKYQACDLIISRGDIGNNLYIIKEGLVSCRIGVKEVRKLGNNDYFGQNAILVDVKRALDVVALQTTTCYELSRDSLKEALGNDYINVILFCFFTHSIERTTYLKDLFIQSVIHEIFKVFKIKKYDRQQGIIETVTSDSKVTITQNKKIIIILDGGIYKQNPLTIIGEKGKVLGEEIFKDYSQALPNDLVAYPDCISLEANIEDLCQVMKIDLNNVKPLNVLNRISKLKKLNLFKNLSEKTLELIARKLQKIKYEKDEVIVAEKTFGETFYLISKGNVRVSINGKVLRNIEKGNCFGENVLLKEGEQRTATVTANEKVTCYVLTKKEFDIILANKTIKNYLLKQLALQNTTISLSDLFYIKPLGKGKFGTVSLVHNKENVYAIKAVSRTLVDRQKILSKYFLNERRIMLSLDHPFVVKMVKSLKNEFFCFFLIEYVNGKNLDEYLSKRKQKKNIYETQFYIGNILLMLEYLQKKFLAHRDIKPSNIMIDSNGYLKMIDFGTAKVLTDYTNTVIGTPHYIAPEILQGKGYSLSCDFWSLGICMYEIFYGQYPFGQFATEVIEIYKEVLHKEFFFPCNEDKYRPINDFIKCLLCKKVNQRECNISILKSKPFFQAFDFDQLNDFKITPPFLPPVLDLTQMVKKANTPYENYVSQDIYKNSNQKIENGLPTGYNRSWADEF